MDAHNGQLLDPRDDQNNSNDNLSSFSAVIRSVITAYLRFHGTPPQTRRTPSNTEGESSVQTPTASTRLFSRSTYVVVVHMYRVCIVSLFVPVKTVASKDHVANATLKSFKVPGISMLYLVLCVLVRACRIQ